jgi:hypothetical protein
MTLDTDEKSKNIGNPIKDLIKYFQKEPGHALTFGYLLLIFIGLIFDFYFYRGFNINVIQFVELDDLLLAPIQDVLVLATIFLFSFILYLIIEFDIWWSIKYPENYRKWYKYSMYRNPFSENAKRQRYFMFCIGFIAYIFFGATFYGKIKAKKVKKGEADKIHFSINNPTRDSLFNQNKSLFFIGKTKSFVFVFDTILKKTSILNIGEIQKIEFENDNQSEE